MTYQELMQKKIEEASIDYQLSERPICLGGDAFADDVRRLNINLSFIAGANFLLDNLWISVKEALPEPSELVFVKGKYDSGGVGYAIERRCDVPSDPYLDDNGFIQRFDYHVTHWMPIPGNC